MGTVFLTMGFSAVDALGSLPDADLRYLDRRHRVRDRPSG
jgi:hypothetical protein